MNIKTTAKLTAVLLAGAALVSVGCETSARSTGTVGPSTVPAERIAPVEKERTDVDIDIGGGQGIRVDVDRNDTSPRRRGADVDVQVGGPDGVRVDVDEKP